MITTPVNTTCLCTDNLVHCGSTFPAFCRFATNSLYQFTVGGSPTLLTNCLPGICLTEIIPTAAVAVTGSDACSVSLPNTCVARSINALHPANHSPNRWQMPFSAITNVTNAGSDVILLSAAAGSINSTVSNAIELVQDVQNALGSATAPTVDLVLAILNTTVETALEGFFDSVANITVPVPGLGGTLTSLAELAETVAQDVESAVVGAGGIVLDEAGTLINMIIGTATAVTNLEQVLQEAPNAIPIVEPLILNLILTTLASELSDLTNGVSYAASGIFETLKGLLDIVKLVLPARTTNPLKGFLQIFINMLQVPPGCGLQPNQCNGLISVVKTLVSACITSISDIPFVDAAIAPTLQSAIDAILSTLESEAIQAAYDVLDTPAQLLSELPGIGIIAEPFQFP
ncbi:hypothetical protein BGZ46_007088 [Entomortierella lignicola]|nr:hypothetical protein BGZ46_007088 [Entomortierella lignicola]